MQIHDASGALIEIPEAPARIVSLVPSVTETLFALGLGDRVVGITDWCLHPADALRSIPRVKGTKNPDLAAIEAQAPDLVLANLEENRKVDVERLREHGIRVWVDFPQSVAGVVEHVRALAQLGAPRETADEMLGELERAMSGARTRAEPAKRCFLAVWKDPWMTISAATYAHDLLAHLGMANLFAEASERYPRVTLDEIGQRDPEIILLPDEPYSFADGDVRELEECLAHTSAGRHHQIHVVDGTLAFWHGPRTIRALKDGLIPNPC